MRKGHKILLIIFLIVVIIAIGCISINSGLFSMKPVRAIDVMHSFDYLGENGPIASLIGIETDRYQEIRSKELLEEKRRELEIQRLEEEKERMKEEMQALEKDPNAKFAYLTFDDGPSPKATPAILDILAEYDIKATFFVVGSRVMEYPELVKRIYEEGHAIGNHTFTHNYRFIYKNTKNFMYDVNRADRALKAVLGDEFETRLFRFPGGSFGKNKIPMIKAIEKAGYTVYDWNALNGDAEGLNLKNSHLINRLKATTRGKKNAIILMHDLDSKVGTVQTLRKNIDYLISQGYNFRLLEEKND